MAQVTNFDDSTIQDTPRFKRFKGEKGRTARIFLISRDVIKDYSHFKEGYGYFGCLSNKAGQTCPACEQGVKTNTRIGMHVLVYDTDNAGVLKTPFNFNIEAFIFGPSTFGKLRSIRNEWSEKMFKMDLKVTCSNSDYQHLDFIPSQDSVFLNELQNLETTQGREKAAEVMKEIKDKIASMDLAKVIAPAIDAETMKKVLSGEVVGRFSKNKPVTSGFAGAQTTTQPASTGNKSVDSLLEELSR